jgi:hypothetical protein
MRNILETLHLKIKQILGSINFSENLAVCEIILLSQKCHR